MNFNALKCIVFTPKLYKLTLPSLHINSLPILYTDSIKYLGYMFSSNNSDDNEMLRQMRLLYCRSNRLFRMLNKCSKNVLIELCRSFCTTFYCPYFWTAYKKTTFSKIRVAYNNVYRKLLGLCRRSSVSEMFAMNNISNFEALIRKSIFAFKTRLSNSDNTIYIRTTKLLGYNRHNLESVERYVIHRNLGYCIVFYLFHDSRNIIILVLLLLLFYDIVSNIVLLCR